MKSNVVYIVLLILLFSCTKENTPNYERFFFRFDGADLAIEVNGNIASNVFVLLLHGGPGGNGLEYNAGVAMDMLEEDFAMVYLDQRGQGASQGIYNDSKVTMAQFAKDAEAVAKMIKAKYGGESKVFLMGHSWGGQVGTLSLLDTEIQDVIEGWIEVDGAHDIELLNKSAVEMFRVNALEQIGLGNFVDFWEGVLSFVNGIDTSNITDEESLEINRLGFRAEARIPEVADIDASAFDLTPLPKSPLGVAATISSNLTANFISDEVETVNLDNRLDEILIPTLMIWGRYDFVVPPALGFSALNKIPDASLFIFENSGHSPMIYQPTEFYEVIRDFIFEVIQ